MKPVAIFRHSSGEGPGYFSTFLDDRNIPWQLVKIDEGEAPAMAPDAYAGLCFMGGPMSVNDALPWIAPVLELIRLADVKGIPVIGHCLGGQLMAKAFGGTVSRNAVKEIGWGRVETACPLAADWLGDVSAFEAFHWHGETFTIPEGATRLLASAHCANQAFVRGPHLAMQCHVEMTEAMIRLWCRAWKHENVAPSSSVLTPEQMMVDMASRIAAMREAADRLYGKWITGLRGAGS